VIEMREPDGTQLPLVKTFGEELERAITNRAATRRRSRRRSRRRLGLACAAGLAILSLVTAPGRAASDLVGEWLGLAEPGDPATVEGPRARGNLQNGPINSIVLAAGRAPDGARYEFVIERLPEPARSAPRGEDSGRCLNIEWPDARVGQISPQFGCDPTFPPATVDKNAVKWQGAMFDPSYTTHVQVAGLARSDVTDVRIRYKDKAGAWRDAPVDFFTVTGALRERAGADGPFGVFLGFLPQSWLAYGARYDFRECPPEAHPYDPEAIEVIGYDRHGRAIATETGSNLNSVSGRPVC
jgi:hypothetical protein